MIRSLTDLQIWRALPLTRLPNLGHLGYRGDGLQVVARAPAGAGEIWAPEYAIWGPKSKPTVRQRNAHASASVYALLWDELFWDPKSSLWSGRKLGTLNLRQTSFTVSCRKLLHFVAGGSHHKTPR